MAYSRWSNSCWYTYWSSSSKDKIEDRDNAIFEILYSLNEGGSFTSEELRNDREACICLIRDKCTDAKEEEIEELNEYIDEFLIDVEIEYDERIQKIDKDIDGAILSQNEGVLKIFSDEKDEITKEIIEKLNILRNRFKKET